MTTPKTPAKTGKNKRPTLSDDEAELWYAIADSTVPIRAKPRVPDRGLPDDDAPWRPRSIAKQSGPGRYERMDAEARARRASYHAAPAPTKPKGPAPIAAFDRRDARRIASGKMVIDARLDLHGERQSTAHSLLRGFLLNAQSRGLKTVLVITGKGQRERDDDPNRMLFDDAPRGVLKRIVPQWLGGPDLRHIVLSFTDAHSRHGGHGALYVHLRRG